MATENLPVGQIGLIQQQPDGRIVQIGLTPSQSTMLQAFLTSLSKEKPLLRMGKEYELVLASELDALLEDANRANQ